MLTGWLKLTQLIAWQLCLKESVKCFVRWTWPGSTLFRSLWQKWSLCPLLSSALCILLYEVHINMKITSISKLCCQCRKYCALGHPGQQKLWHFCCPGRCSGRQVNNPAFNTHVDSVKTYGNQPVNVYFQWYIYSSTVLKCNFRLLVLHMRISILCFFIGKYCTFYYLL